MGHSGALKLSCSEGIPVISSPELFLRTRRRSACHCIKHGGKRPRPSTTPKPEGEASNTHRQRCPHTNKDGNYSISPLPPRLQLTQAFQSSSTKRSRVCAEVDSRLNTRAFLSSQSARITNMMRELAAFLSTARNRATASGHHSPNCAC
jgi:hypothetical protein